MICSSFILNLFRGTALNVTARKSLRPYQAHLIADVCRADGPVLVEQPTGSGKTMQIVTLVAMQLGRRFTHAVIAAPQQQIEHAFVHPDYRLVAFPSCQGVAAPDIEVPEGLILGARNSKQLNSASRLIAYLRHHGSPGLRPRLHARRPEPLESGESAGGSFGQGSLSR